MGFSDLHDTGIDAVVARIEIAYKYPLRSGDKFVCKLYVVKEGVKYVFHQAIYRKPDNQLCVTAKVVTVVTINGKLTVNFELFDRLVEQTNA